MSRSLHKILIDNLIKIHLDIMNTALFSPERTVLIQDARNIEKQLTADTVVAG